MPRATLGQKAKKNVPTVKCFCPTEKKFQLPNFFFQPTKLLPPTDKKNCYQLNYFPPDKNNFFNWHKQTSTNKTNSNRQFFFPPTFFPTNKKFIPTDKQKSQRTRKHPSDKFLFQAEVFFLQPTNSNIPANVHILMQFNLLLQLLQRSASITGSLLGQAPTRMCLGGRVRTRHVPNPTWKWSGSGGHADHAERKENAYICIHLHTSSRAFSQRRCTVLLQSH